MQTWCFVSAVDPEADVLVHSEVPRLGVIGQEHLLSVVERSGRQRCIKGEVRVCRVESVQSGECAEWRVCRVESVQSGKCVEWRVCRVERVQSGECAEWRVW